MSGISGTHSIIGIWSENGSLASSITTATVGKRSAVCPAASEKRRRIKNSKKKRFANSMSTSKPTSTCSKMLDGFNAISSFRSQIKDRTPSNVVERLSEIIA